MYYFTVTGPGERLDEDWGDCVWYVEADDRLRSVRQLEIYDNGNVLAYDLNHQDDEYGGLGLANEEFLLADDPNDELEEEWSYTKITTDEFEQAWAFATPINR